MESSFFCIFGGILLSNTMMMWHRLQGHSHCFIFLATTNLQVKDFMYNYKYVRHFYVCEGLIFWFDA
jgi:hypothetical protein